ncbi:MAG: endonuclease MutS2 [Anaerolineales bacterium]
MKGGQDLYDASLPRFGIQRRKHVKLLTMDAKSIQKLELPIILDRLSACAAFSASKELARGLTPTSSASQIARRLQETSEARRLLSVADDVTVGGARDVRAEAGAAERGAVLEPAQLLDIKHTLISARTLRRRFEKSDDYPALSDIALGLEPVEGLIDRISGTVDERGHVPDRASSALASIRAEARVAHDRLTSKLQNLISDSSIASMLQEPIITQRDGRFVVPLRAEFKGRLKAVVHDQSSSGATLFVEPLQVVELNNSVRELELAERDEIRRLLAELSAQVGAHAAEIRSTVDALARLDLAFAKARYADGLDAQEPLLAPFEEQDGSHPGSSLHFVQARHPLLDPAQVVPVDLVLDNGTYALVITGPNTGGKTVALKTAGLLVLMAECGLHIPVESGSGFSPFDDVFADIGDEQSIEQSLSTFSSHISNIIRILEQADSKSLVLLDELGAGTDPQEGAALAQALLEAFLARRSTTLVATHYSALKIFAHNTPGVSNASVEFDLKSLRPTYHLVIGLPGRSNALAIARRLGLEEPIIERARSMVAPEELQAETLLNEIYAQRDQAREARSQAEEARKRAHAKGLELDQRLERIEDERMQILSDARSEARGEIETLQEEIAGLRRRLAIAGQPLDALEPLEKEAGELAEQVSEPVLRAATESRAKQRPLRLGDRVFLSSINTEGVITGLSEDQVEVQVGRLRVRARQDEIRLKGEAQPSTTPPPEPTRTTPIPGGVPPLELDLRGRTAEEALEELERRLDAAYLSGMPYVRVIHGKGTGKLRQVIREWLGSNRYVGSYSSGTPAEGGDGVTVIKLALD